jgi:hypothetical protein
VSDEWEELVRLLRSYARRKYGRDAVGLTIHLHDQAQHYEPSPPAWLVEERQQHNAAQTPQTSVRPP